MAKVYSFPDAINGINKLTGSKVRLRDGEIHLPLSRYTGPNTDLQ
jgi:hypothetical protein